VGRSATSAISANPFRIRETGTFNRTADASNELVVARSAPRKSARPRSAGRCANPAPSSSIAAVRLAVPNLPAGSSCRARLDQQTHLHQRHGVRFDEPHREPVAQSLFLDLREIELRARAREAGGADRSGLPLRSDRQATNDTKNNAT
jgi:hypothetical protein